MPIRSGMTRWSIWPSVSSVSSSSPRRPWSSARPPLRELDPLAQLEGVVVGDDDLGPVDVVEHVAGHQLAARVVAVRVVRLEHAQAVLDREPGRDDEEAAREALALRPAHGVDRLPGDQHRHDGRLARAGGELQREPHQLRVGVVVRVRQVLEEPLAAAVDCGATSVSQIAVSTASTWQKNGRTPLNSWCRQCWSSRAVSGVTCHSLGLRQRAPLVHLAGAPR